MLESLGEDVEKEEDLFAAGEMQIGIAIMKVSTEAPQKMKNRMTS